METQIVYFDETGDDGNNTKSSDTFVLTGIYMPSSSWHDNYEKIKQERSFLYKKYGFHIRREMHTKYLITDKGEFRSYNWLPKQRKDIITYFAGAIASMNLSIINVIIDKGLIRSPDYPILENALKYNIQRIENALKDDYNYIIITDAGRVAPMRKTARAMQAYNPIKSKYSGTRNLPVKYLIEDILEKDSRESYFIQICDFVSYFVYLYYKTVHKNQELPNRVGQLIDKEYVLKLMNYLNDNGRFNLKASQNEYGLVIYPTK